MGEAATAACSGSHLTVEERQRRQRLQAELHQRAAAAAAVGRAYHATLEQRERQRMAAAQEQERLHSRWAAVSAAGGPRHAPAGTAARRPSSGGSSGGSTASSRGDGCRAAAGATATAAPGQRDARFWMLYTMHWQRIYEADSDADNYWGSRATGGMGDIENHASNAAGGCTCLWVCVWMGGCTSTGSSECSTDILDPPAGC